jgi:hypothetical protein
MDTQPEELFQQFEDIFTARGWLGQTLSLKYRDRKYRVLCSEKALVAYRVNEHQGASPGAPGWVVCYLDRDQIVEESAQSPSASTEPSAGEWLTCLAQGNFDAK